MEPMRLTVEEIRRSREEGLLIARVRAVSRERISGASRAIIRIEIRLKDPGADVNFRQLTRLARDEALRFLDIS
jgi:hypothetical protein